MSAARAKAIFLDAIEAPAARREAVVRSACGSDGRLADRVRACSALRTGRGRHRGPTG